MRSLDRHYRLNDIGNRLQKAKDDGEEQDKCRNPERIPLDLLTIIPPPMPHTWGFRIIERLLQNSQPLSPILEFFEMPLRSIQMAVAPSTWVKLLFVSFAFLLVPFVGDFAASW